jgi:hypothetical protein
MTSTQHPAEQSAANENVFHHEITAEMNEIKHQYLNRPLARKPLVEQFYSQTHKRGS